MKSTNKLALIAVAGAMLIANTSLAASRTDNRINNEIFNALLSNDSLAMSPTGVAVATSKDSVIMRTLGAVSATTKNGVVTLKGQVLTPEDKQQLYDAIAALPGVQHVDDSQVSTGIVFMPAPAMTDQTGGQ
ncbi:MAG TPA: BON domain-containing protein [Verrucomicrobiae bacterium]|jgi:osmotically-inducible protein OsmY